MNLYTDPYSTFSRYYLVIGAALAALAVILGAFGAHGLKQVLSPESLTTFETGVRYQMYHGLAILALPALITYSHSRWLNPVALGFVLGCLMFSGSLYALAMTGAKWFGPITPLGGVFFITGWGMLVVALLKGNKQTGKQNKGNRHE